MLSLWSSAVTRPLWGQAFRHLLWSFGCRFTLHQSPCLHLRYVCVWACVLASSDQLIFPPQLVCSLSGPCFISEHSCERKEKKVCCVSASVCAVCCMRERLDEGGKAALVFIILCSASYSSVGTWKYLNVVPVGMQVCVCVFAGGKVCDRTFTLATPRPGQQSSVFLWVSGLVNSVLWESRGWVS